MSLTNPNTPVSQQDLQDFYHKILPYMGGSSGGGGGHTIEDAEGTDLTQRDTMQFGTGFKATDDSENEKTVVNADVMQSGDMDDIVTPLPSITARLHKYSTEEQIVGEWIDGSPVYEIAESFSGNFTKFENKVGHLEKVFSATSVDKLISSEGYFILDDREKSLNSSELNWNVGMAFSSNFVVDTNNTIQLRIVINLGNYTDTSTSGYAILRYTKTTT